MSVRSFAPPPPDGPSRTGIVLTLLMAACVVALLVVVVIAFTGCEPSMPAATPNLREVKAAEERVCLEYKDVDEAEACVAKVRARWRPVLDAHCDAHPTAPGCDR